MIRAAVLLLLSFVAVPSMAMPVTIDFEELPDQGGVFCGPVCVPNPTDWQSQGYTLRAEIPAAPAARLVSAGVTTPLDRTLGIEVGNRVLLSAGYLGPLTFTLTQDAGETFAFAGFDFWRGLGQAAEFTVTGTRRDGSAVTELLNTNLGGWQSLSYGSEWTDLVALEFATDGLGTQFEIFMFDNIRLTVVPVPAALWLFVSAFGALAAQRALSVRR